MTVLMVIDQIWRDAAAIWRELFRIETAPDPQCRLENADDDERNAEARERERIELAIMTAHFHI